MTNNKNYRKDISGLYLLGLRLVIGWAYFSALWRRTVLADKLDPDTAGYIGEKFNHFLPQALGIKPVIEYLLTHPYTLWWAMLIFTLLEGIVGLFLMFGLFSRGMSLGVIGLAFGILLGSGWLGTTCLDEWQIGVLGLAGGFALFWSGGGPVSMDHWIQNRFPKLQNKSLWIWLSSGELPQHHLKKPIIIGTLFIFGLTLFTNQYFHGGVWGKLHNMSVRPELEIENAAFHQNQLNFEVFRTEGADVYGSFLIQIELLDEKDEAIWMMDNNALAALPPSSIHNRYITKVKPGKHSLVIPLGAKAVIEIPIAEPIPKHPKQIRLTDISGLQWTQKIE